MLYQEIVEYFKDNDIDSCASKHIYMYNIVDNVKAHMSDIDKYLEEKDMVNARRSKDLLIRMVEIIESSEAFNISPEDWEELKKEHFFS